MKVKALSIDDVDELLVRKMVDSAVSHIQSLEGTLSGLGVLPIRWTRNYVTRQLTAAYNKELPKTGRLGKVLEVVVESAAQVLGYERQHIEFVPLNVLVDSTHVQIFAPVPVSSYKAPIYWVRGI